MCLLHRSSCVVWLDNRSYANERQRLEKDHRRARLIWHSAFARRGWIYSDGKRTNEKIFLGISRVHKKLIRESDCKSEARFIQRVITEPSFSYSPF